MVWLWRGASRRSAAAEGVLNGPALSETSGRERQASVLPAKTGKASLASLRWVGDEASVTRAEGAAKLGVSQAHSLPLFTGDGEVAKLIEGS